MQGIPRSNIMEAADELASNHDKRNALVESFGKFVASVSSIEFSCVVNTHAGSPINPRLKLAPFHVIACEDGVPDTDQELIDSDAQRALCQRIINHLRDYICSMESIDQILHFRKGAYDTINLNTIFGDYRRDLQCFGYYNSSYISDLFHTSRVQSRVHAGGMCFDLERLMKSICASFVGALDDAIRSNFELHSHHVSYSSFQHDQELKAQLVDHIAAHVSMAYKHRSPLYQNGHDRKTLDIEYLKTLANKQVDSEARLLAERERDADVQRIGRLRDLVFFCSTLEFELLRVLLEHHRKQLIHLLENPPPCFKRSGVVGKFSWDGLLHILVVHDADDLLMLHTFKWARSLFVTEAISEALIKSLDELLVSTKSQTVSSTGFLPTLAKLVQANSGGVVPLPAWCRLPVGGEQAKLTREMQDLLRAGVFSTIGSAGSSSMLPMPPDTERRMRLVSAILELAANESTAKLFFSHGVFLAEYVRRVVVTQRETAQFSVGLVRTVAASSELGQNYLKAKRRVVNFQGTDLESTIRQSSIHLSNFSSAEIFAASTLMGDELSRGVFKVARDHLVKKCPTEFYALVSRSMNSFLVPFLKIREISGVPTFRPSSILEDSLRSIPSIMRWVQTSQGVRGAEFILSIPDAKEGVKGAYELLQQMAKQKNGLICKKRLKTKVVFIVNGFDLFRRLQLDVPVPVDESRISEVDK